MQLTCKKCDCIYWNENECLLQEVSLDEAGVCQKYCPGLPEEWNRSASPEESVRRLWEETKKASRKKKNASR